MIIEVILIIQWVFMHKIFTWLEFTIFKQSILINPLFSHNSSVVCVYSHMLGFIIGSHISAFSEQNAFSVLKISS